MNEVNLMYEDACSIMTEGKTNGESAAAYRSNWERKFNETYTGAINAASKDFWSSSISVMNAEREILDEIKKITDKTEQLHAVQTVCKGIQEISKKFVHDSKSLFIKGDNDTRDEFINEYVSTLSVAAEMLYSCGDDLEAGFHDKYYALAVNAWKEAISINSYYTKYVLNKDEHVETINKYAAKILRQDKDYKAPQISGMKQSGSFMGSLMKKLFGSRK